ncbi:MAG: hypothetical protein II139_04060 [Lachnospiraceae bacterium]|nr:hypothetical protein [Lachnospiraceae bacterium]
MKKVLKLLGRMLLHGIVLGLIWLDFNYVRIPEWVALALTILWIVTVRIAEHVMQKKSSNIFYGILDTVIVLFMIVSTLLNPYWNSDVYRKNVSWEENGSKFFSKEDALSDYEFMMKYLKKIHPLALGGLPADVEARAQEVRKWIEGQDKIEGYVLARELESILSLLGDGHTMVEENYDSYHIMKHVYEHNKAGDTLVGINGILFEEFLAQNPTIESYETVDYGIRMIKNRIVNLEGLKYLGVDTSGEITYNYVSEDGEEILEVVRAEDFLVMEEYLIYEEEVTGDDLHSDEDRGFVYYDIDEEHSLAILTLNSCRYNKTYKDTVKKLFDEVHEKGIQNVCVDLRYNGGGSSMVGDEFIKYLDVDAYRSWGEEMRLGYFLIKSEGRTVKNPKKKQVFTGNVYVLTGVRSYSAAMDFAMLIKDNGIGKLVGQPCGNMPASYGQVVHFHLPKTGFYMQISMKKWYRVDMTKNGEPLYTDIECPEADALDILINQIESGKEF